MLIEMRREVYTVTTVYVPFMKYAEGCRSNVFSGCGCDGVVRGDGRSHPRAALRLPLHVAQHNLLRLHVERALSYLNYSLINYLISKQTISIFQGCVLPD